MEGPITEAAARAPTSAGVYFVLGHGAELLYVGKAGNLRQRLRQHATAKPGAGGPRLDALYARAREVRWEGLPDEEAAAVREADLIVALRPAFNSGSDLAGRWNYILVDPFDGDRHRFTLAPDAGTGAGGQAYGCFPHLGRGVGTVPGIACSDGYTALLRMLWAASHESGSHIPSRITRSAPDTFSTLLPPTLRRPLHALLSGTSSRVLDGLAMAGAQREAYLQPALRRDRRLAGAFFRYGSQALRRLRLRHGGRPGPLSRTVIEEVLTAEVREAIGEFRLPAPPDPNAAHLGRNAHPWTRSGHEPGGTR